MKKKIFVPIVCFAVLVATVCVGLWIYDYTKNVEYASGTKYYYVESSGDYLFSVDASQNDDAVYKFVITEKESGEEYTISSQKNYDVSLNASDISLVRGKTYTLGAYYSTSSVKTGDEIGFVYKEKIALSASLEDEDIVLAVSDFATTIFVQVDGGTAVRYYYNILKQNNFTIAIDGLNMESGAHEVYFWAEGDAEKTQKSDTLSLEVSI